MSNNPSFFSVCMPVTNRGTTIFQALSSVAHQTCRDFELIIIDCGSTDNSRTEIERFFASETFQNHSFPYQYEVRDYVPQTVEDWNEPVRLATGRYIAMLEGDDQFLPAYLQTAYEKLSEQPNIGVYATGNQLRPRGYQGLMTAQEAAQHIYSLQEVPPPSETIFIRTDTHGNPFLYNDRDFEYAPETDLYLRILLSGYDYYCDSFQHTVRDISAKNRTTWHYFHDQFFIAEAYAPQMGAEMHKELVHRFLRLAAGAALYSRNFSNIKSMTLHLADAVGWWPTCCAYISVLANAVRKRLPFSSSHKA